MYGTQPDVWHGLWNDATRDKLVGVCCIADASTQLASRYPLREEIGWYIGVRDLVDGNKLGLYALHLDDVGLTNYKKK